jgi:endonuclease/exonuclease/phosphatase family metal-dependent hydrolase
MRAAVWIASLALALGLAMRSTNGAIGCAEPEVRSAPYQPAPASKPPGELTIVSINLAKETDVGRIAEEIRKDSTLGRADVLSLQEVIREGTNPSVAERLAAKLGMSVAVAGTGDGGNGDNRDSIALLSRFPLTDPQVIQLPRNGLGLRSRCRVALAATIEGLAQPVRVVGLHLDTRVNAESRLLQLEPVLAASADFQGPVVLAGDFNTNGFWWVEHLLPIPFVSDQAQSVFEHLRGAGFSTPFAPGGQATNDFLGLQLDWVFLRGLEAASSGVAPLDFSDHHAVWVRTESRHEK